MRGKCWVCSRQARGLGHTDNRHPIGDAKRYPLDWVFCSRRCQDIFHQMYGRWVDAQKFGQEVEMIDATDIERSAMRSCLRAFGEVRGGYRSLDYPFGYLELLIDPATGKGDGTFIEAAQIRWKRDKKLNQYVVEIEDFGTFPARLMGVSQRDRK